MTSPKVRLVAITHSGRKEVSDWYVNGSPQAIEAMLSLIRKHTDIVSLDWEEKEEAEG
jgi:hypothetical protein